MRTLLLAAVASVSVCAQDSARLIETARRHFTALVKLDTTNPPGNETRVAEYLKKAVEAEGIACELLGPDPSRLNFVARLKGSGAARPLLLMAHSDVVPADPAQWTVPAFAGEVRDGFLYGRGTQDDKSLLAAELAVFLELKRSRTPLDRDVILLAEADEEAGSTGIQWLIDNAYAKIDAEFAINEGGYAFDGPAGRRLFQIQTTEKIPSRVLLTARGVAGHGSLPREDNAVVHLARAITRLADAELPVRMNTTTARYFRELSRLQGYEWLAPLSAQLADPAHAGAAANQLRERDRRMGASVRTTVSPTMLTAGMKINVIPNQAEAQIDVRRLPNETREEVLSRFRAIVNDQAVQISSAPGQEMPATEPSSLTTPLYLALEKVLKASHPSAIVLPYMSQGATDGAFLRAKGMAVYGAPIFMRPESESRAHGNDERLPWSVFDAGASLLWKAVVTAAAR